MSTVLVVQGYANNLWHAAINCWRTTNNSWGSRHRTM